MSNNSYSKPADAVDNGSNRAPRNQIYVNQSQFENIPSSRPVETPKKRIPSVEEEPEDREEQNKQAELLKKKQYENPYLKRMREQQQKQQELIRQQLQQNQPNLNGIDSSV